jgi:signal transduction histidine kinase
MPRRLLDSAIYAGLGLVAVLVATALSYTPVGARLDNSVEDWFATFHPVRTPARQAAVLAFDERTYRDYNGIYGLRATLARALEILSTAPPAVVAVDLTLADAAAPEVDAALARAFSHTNNLVLSCLMLPNGQGWEEPPALFARASAGLGHAHAWHGPFDDINRRIALERVAGGRTRFALSLEALRLRQGARFIRGSPVDLTAGRITIPSRWDDGRPLRVRFRDASLVPHVSVHDLLERPALARTLAGRVVFTGVTALSASPDRLFTPLSSAQPWPGVEFHAQAYETMAAGDFLVDAPLSTPLLLSLAAVLLLAASFLLPGRFAYAGAAFVVLALHAAPWLAYQRGVVLPASGLSLSAWLALGAMFAWRYFTVRHHLDAAERTSHRYQQAFRFIAHELRTPLTAIQGSGEMLNRYNLPEDKRRQLATMIQSESRRLAKMITTFLDVEKLDAGQMELRRSQFALADVIDTVVERARPLADRKQIVIEIAALDALALNADRELLEYAVYNLLTNAVKYSPAGKRVMISAASRGRALALTVRDEGIGMDAEDLKRLFTRFFRSRRAEATGETGTGIGLAIVEQIVALHGGRIDVESKPGLGSAFTIELPTAL